MKENIIKVKPSTDVFIELPEGFAEEGEKVNISHTDDGVITISKMVSVEIDLDKETLFELAMIAHERDITLNELCAEILEEYISDRV